MAGLNRRLAALERWFGPALAEAPDDLDEIEAADQVEAEQPDAAAEPLGPNEQFKAWWSSAHPIERSAWAREQLALLEQVKRPTEYQVRWIDWLRKSDHPDRCRECKAWPMAGIRIDRDGSIRCGSCSVLLEFLPPATCIHYGHGEPCSFGCGYDYRSEVRHLWFYEALERDVRLALIRRFDHAA